LKVFNLSAAKSVSIPGREGMSVEFRADAQNVFNHASFGFPSNSLGGSSGAGTAYTNTSPISTTSVQGRNLQLALRVNF